MKVLHCLWCMVFQMSLRRIEIVFICKTKAVEENTLKTKELTIATLEKLDEAMPLWFSQQCSQELLLVL